MSVSAKTPFIRTAGPLAAALCAAALFGPSAPADAQTELRLSTFTPPVGIVVRGLIVPWAEEVKKATDGEVTVTVYPSMQLGGSPPELYRQVAQGVVDLVFTLPGYTSPAFPRTQMIELPGLKQDGFEATAMMWDLMDPYLAPEYEAVKVIALWAADDAGLMTTARPIRSLDDMKGLRLRTPSAAQATQLEALGATPVATPIPELYPGMERGVLDGALVPFTVILDFRIGEVARHYTITGPVFGRSSFLVAMNKRKFDSLPARHREAIDKLSGRDRSHVGTRLYVERAKEALDSVQGKATLTEWSAEEQRRVSEELSPIIDRWIEENEAKGIPAREMLRIAGHPAAER